MKEHPVIFSTPAVRALLNTKPDTWPAKPINPDKPFKSMTRRVMKPQPEYRFGEGKREMYKWKEGLFALNFYPDRSTILENAPYKPGDILWVRETFGIFDDEGEYTYLYYKADEGNPEKSKYFGKWKPSIHMPREAARLFLEVKSVRVERLRDISEKDAKAEGVEKFNQCKTLYEDRVRNRIIACGGGAYPIVHCVDCEKYKNTSFKNGFLLLWDSLNVKRGCSWESNPRVWVYEFMRVKG